MTEQQYRYKITTRDGESFVGQISRGGVEAIQVQRYSEDVNWLAFADLGDREIAIVKDNVASLLFEPIGAPKYQLQSKEEEIKERFRTRLRTWFDSQHEIYQFKTFRGGMKSKGWERVLHPELKINDLLAESTLIGYSCKPHVVFVVETRFCCVELTTGELLRQAGLIEA